jgi:hypothetical protein
MQFLGYRHVIATMWTIADPPAPRVADIFYTKLRQIGYEPGSASNCRPEAASQILIVRSSPAETSHLPSGAAATAVTALVCPARTPCCLWVVLSKIRTVLS